MLFISRGPRGALDPKIQTVNILGVGAFFLNWKIVVYPITKANQAVIEP